MNGVLGLDGKPRIDVCGMRMAWFVMQWGWEG